MPCSQTFLLLILIQNYVHAKEEKRSRFGAVVTCAQTFFARIIRENIENPSFFVLFFKEKCERGGFVTKHEESRLWVLCAHRDMTRDAQRCRRA